MNKTNKQVQTIVHPWTPVFNEHSRILILGTIPSPKSRENGFYYGHPQNLFWKILAEVLKKPSIPADIESKKKFLLDNHIALWDVLYSCDIVGASDNSIKNAIANDFVPLLTQAPIKAIFTTGKTASKLYDEFCLPYTGFPSQYLPSTSPANKAHYPYDKLLKHWQIITNFL
ncbi:MAG: DNA-deoxyinosine glycosylase [Bacillota bacterium]|jgi:TDG/mug DNA glycosylase family protein